MNTDINHIPVPASHGPPRNAIYDPRTNTLAVYEDGRMEETGIESDTVVAVTR